MRFKALGTTVLGICVLSAVLPAAAPALSPIVSILPGEAFPFTANGTVTGVEVVKLETEIGEKITAEELKLLLVVAGTLLGTFDAHFVKANNSGKECSTTGDAAGVALVKGKYHTVFLSLSPLKSGVLLPVEEMTVTCGEKKIKFKGVLVTEIGTTANDISSGTTPTVKCSKIGVNEWTTYINEKGETKTKEFLLANFGLGFEQSCAQLSKELTLTSSKMITILG
jgi:hypothetical protein